MELNSNLIKEEIKMISTKKITENQKRTELRNSIEKFCNIKIFDYEIEAILRDLRAKKIDLVTWSNNEAKNSLNELLHIKYQPSQLNLF